jgi:pilus assembly protein CpaB
MDVRKMLLLIGALVFAGITAFVARSLFDEPVVSTAAAAERPAEISGPKVLVAVKPLPLGTILTAEMTAFQPWPKDMVDKAYFLAEGTDAASLVGKVVRYSILPGQPIPQGALVGPGERGFLAAALGPGMRAVTVSVSDTSGVGGFLFPGDRVDLVLTQEVGGGEGQALRVAETMVRNLRILAVDQRVDPGSEAKVGRTVTLEVTPKLAEKIAVAQTVGSLSLSLRALADSAAELERAIASGEVEVGENQDVKADRALEIAIARMPSDSNPSFTTGGEVSRFQRTSAPAQKSDDPNGAPATSADKPRGPVVRIARGNDVSVVAMGAN